MSVSDSFVSVIHILSISSLTYIFPSDMRDKNSQTPLHKCCGSWRDILVVVEYMVENTNCDVSE